MPISYQYRKTNVEMYLLFVLVISTSSFILNRSITFFLLINNKIALVKIANTYVNKPVCSVVADKIREQGFVSVSARYFYIWCDINVSYDVIKSKYNFLYISIYLVLDFLYSKYCIYIAYVRQRFLLIGR